MGKRRIPKYQELLKKGIPAILIPGIIFAAAYGVNVAKIKDYSTDKKIFPTSGVVIDVEDGDTFSLTSGQKVRMIGVDAPNRGADGFEESKEALTKLIGTKKIWLEYDRYQDDKYGRILAWVWVKCETNEPKFLPADYMHLSGNESRDYVAEKPEGCREGELVNKTMVNKNRAEKVEYEKRGRLKYKL